MINIADQFKINVELPIDSRIVASGSTARNAIPYKYDGLVVYDIGDRKTYVWNSSGAGSWQLTDISGGGNGTQSSGYISRWSSTSGLTASPLYNTVVNGSTIGKIGINITTPSDLKEVFQVNSANTGSQPIVIHKGSTDNIIGSNWYNTGSDGYFSVSTGSGVIKFRDNGEIWIMTREANAGALVSTSASPSSNTVVIFPAASTGYVNFLKSLYFNSAGNSGSAAFIKSAAGYSTPTTPDYTWWYNDQTGIYHPASDRIGMSIAGSQKFILNSTGLLLTNGNNVTTASSRLHLDGGNSVGSFLQFTAGTLTGTGTNTGFLIGISGAGYPTLSSRYSNLPYLLTFTNGNSFYKIGRNELTIYSRTDGENFATAVTNNTGHKTIQGTGVALSVSAGSVVVSSIAVPNSCLVSVEATFVASTNSPRQFKTNKIIAAYSVNSSGVITSQNTGGSPLSGISLAMLSSSNSSMIAGGIFDISSTNTIKLVQSFAVASGYSTTSFKAVINIGYGT
jgi:hypothetical protein